MTEKSKVALITGSGRGIGRGIALHLAKAGWTIVINDFGNPEPPKETLRFIKDAGGDGIIIMADITKPDNRFHIVQETLQTFNRIDLLVNNAGIGPRVRMDMLETTVESMWEVLNVNLVASFFLTQIVSKEMIRLIKEGLIVDPKIVNISSMSAYTSSTSRAEYCISKAGVSMSTLLFADRLAEEGINVYEIRPGIIKTPLTEIVADKYDKLIAEGITPIKRWGQPEDIAKAILAIAEGYFPFTTGQAFDVDGGFHIHRL
jgi:NAD(P)-dependent dehydrogenase (short-subunit alcohol dehydrogenase family)